MSVSSQLNKESIVLLKSLQIWAVADRCLVSRSGTQCREEVTLLGDERGFFDPLKLKI